MEVKAEEERVAYEGGGGELGGGDGGGGDGGGGLGGGGEGLKIRIRLKICDVESAITTRQHESGVVSNQRVAMRIVAAERKWPRRESNGQIDFV